MSVREYAVLYVGGKPAGTATVVGGGNSVLTAGKHPIDGAEHTAASDQTRLDASTTAHGLLPKLSGDTGTYLRGDGAWTAPPSIGNLDGGTASTTYGGTTAVDGGGA